MTAIKELRAMLDERGVKHKFNVYSGNTQWATISGEVALAKPCKYNESNVDLIANGITPAQAVEATLGRGECRFEWSLAENGWANHTCSACGYSENTDVHVSIGFNFCPNCGRQVKR